MISYRLKKTMSFTACCWKSRRIKETHVEFWERIYLQISRVSPLHLQAHIFLFTHAYWWQSHVACVWIFRLPVSPSSRKTEKKHFPWLESNKSCHFAGFAGVLRGVLVGKNVFQWLLWYLRIIARSKPFRMPQSSSVLCGANLDLPNAFLFSK